MEVASQMGIYEAARAGISELQTPLTVLSNRLVVGFSKVSLNFSSLIGSIVSH